MEGSVAEILELPGESSRLSESTAVQSDPHLLGVDELNLAEFPLAACGYKVDPSQKTLIFEDTIFDEGQKTPVKRKLIIAASDAWGLPTPVDSDVLLVLMHLTRVKNSFTSREVSFSRYELIQLLGWNDGGRSYQRLEQALQRWTSVTLSYNRAWWDRTGQTWRTRTFHVIESLDLRGRDSGQGPDLQSKFTWNEVLFGSFQANNIKRLDLTTYFQIELPVARQMFRFLDKRFYRTAKLEFDLKYFGCEHVGLSRKYDNSQLQRRLLPAITELESIGFLVKLPKEKRFRQVRRGEWKIVLIADPSYSKPKPKQNRQPTTESLPSLESELVSRGVTRKVAAELISEFSADAVKSKLDQVGVLIKAKDKRVAKNGAGYLVAAIRNDYQIETKSILPTRPKAYGEKPPQAPTAKEIQISKLEQDEDLKLEEFLSTLSADDVIEFEAGALHNATRMQIESYYRLKPSGGNLFLSLRRQILNDFRKLNIPNNR